MKKPAIACRLQKGLKMGDLHLELVERSRFSMVAAPLEAFLEAQQNSGWSCRVALVFSDHPPGCAGSDAKNHYCY